MGTIIGFAALGIGVIFVLVFLAVFVFTKFVADEEFAVAAVFAAFPATFASLYYSVVATVILVIIAILNSIFAWGL